MSNLFNLLKKDNMSNHLWIELIEAMKIAINYEKNNILEPFFKEYSEYCKIVDNLDAKVEITKMNEYKNKLQEELNKISTIEKEISNMGIKVTKTSGFSKKIMIYTNPEKNDKVAVFYSPYYLFNKIGISLKDLQNNKLIKSDMELERLNNLLNNYDLEELNSKLEILKFNEKTFPYINNQYSSEISKIKEEIDEAKRIKLGIKDINKKKQTFIDFTEEEKEKIKELLTSIKNFGKPSNGYNNTVTFNRISYIYGYNGYKYDDRRKKYTRALKLMIDNNSIDNKRFKLIIEEIKKIIFKMNREDYPNKLFSSEKEKNKCLNVFPEYNLLIKEFLKYLFPNADIEKGTVDINI